MEHEENIYRLVEKNVLVNRVMNTCNAIAAFCEKVGSWIRFMSIKNKGGR